MRNHYHVLAGLHGCMPDVNETFTNKADAQGAMVSLKEEEKEAAWQSVDYVGPCPSHVVGSASDGYYEIYHDGPGWDYIEMTECNEPDCLDDLDN